ncbi:MAG TPA: radical SAM protein [Methanomicrobiales archaeon]|nr:radical SAM protein [Methanomicrobiales archaeon]
MSSRPSLSRGCELCCRGAKMVLFVTGLCHRRCWYCPLSEERSGRDLAFANDRPVQRPEDFIAEARLMDALGTSITGGEPFLVPDRVARFCRTLKETFGVDHHIHLYTGMAPTAEMLLPLTGLVDEIRLHPPQEEWPRIPGSPFARALGIARDLGFAVGIEVPALPGVHALADILPLVDFLNVNELEWGGTNAGEMRRRGYVPADGLHNAVQGSRRWTKDLAHREKVRWCSSRSKDAVQLRERLKRIAARTARPFDEVTGDGTVVYGVFEPEGVSPPRTLGLPEGDYEVCDGAIELSWRALRKRAKRLPGKKYIVERYPNRGVVVEVTPL